MSGTNHVNEKHLIRLEIPSGFELRPNGHAMKLVNGLL